MFDRVRAQPHRAFMIFLSRIGLNINGAATIHDLQSGQVLHCIDYTVDVCSRCNRLRLYCTEKMR